MTAIACASLIATTLTGSGGAVSERTDISGESSRVSVDPVRSETVRAVSERVENQPLRSRTDVGVGSVRTRSETACTYTQHRQLMRAVRFYSWKIRVRENKMGATRDSQGGRVDIPRQGRPCPRFLAKHLRAKAYATRARYERWQREQRRRVAASPAGAICKVFGQHCAMALRVARCESGLNPRAYSSGNYGLFQINQVHDGWVDFSRIYDPLYNAQVAFRLSRGGTEWHANWRWSEHCWG